MTADTLQLYTNASGLGVGAVFEREWLSVALPEQTIRDFTNKVIDNSFLEIFAIIAAVFTWGEVGQKTDTFSHGKLTSIFFSSRTWQRQRTRRQVIKA